MRLTAPGASAVPASTRMPSLLTRYRLDSGAPLIVGCGLGDSNQIPRVYNPPELVLVDVNWY